MNSVEKNAEVARNVAANSDVVSSAVGSLATEWGTHMADEATIEDQQAATEAYLSQLLPDGASPTAILRGDYGEEIQTAFLSGALMTTEQFLTPNE